MSDAAKLIFSALDKSLHQRESFECSEQALTEYLRKRASQDVQRNVARAFVGTFENAPQTILSYYTLSSGSVTLEDLPEDRQKKLPRYPVPVVLIGRLAVDVRHSGKGLGGLTLMSALERSLKVTQDAAAWAVVVDAKNEGARAFYQRYGFEEFPQSSHRLFLPLKTLATLF